jgi:hypothetical protein
MAESCISTYGQSLSSSQPLGVSQKKTGGNDENRPLTGAGTSTMSPGGALIVNGGGFPIAGGGLPVGFSGFSGPISHGFQGFGGGFNGMARFPFTIDPKTPLKNLLPVPPDLQKARPPWLVADLAQVPEVFFQKTLPINVPTPKDFEQRDNAEKEKLNQQIRIERQRAMQHIAHTLAKINQLNQKETDHFVKLLVENRPDLAGLPFILGDECRMSKGISRRFMFAVAQVRGTLSPGAGFSGGLPSGTTIVANTPFRPTTSPPQCTPDEIAKAEIAALMQMLAPEPTARRKELVKTLSGMEHRESTRALAQLAVFSFEKEVRDAALVTLKNRPKDDATEVLLRGLRYPWPAVVQNAAQAAIQLQRKDLIPTLVDFLDEPDPRAPVVRTFQGRTLPTVHEVVRLNHHHNCITCHAPATSDAEFNKSGFTGEFASGAVSIPGLELTPPSFGYMLGSPDIVVRADITYLRQDFSLLQEVPNAQPWPALQRFDFLIRTREASPKEVDGYQTWLKKQGPTYRPPHQQAAQMVLRKLTGRDVEPTAAAWRTALVLDDADSP